MKKIIMKRTVLKPKVEKFLMSIIAIFFFILAITIDSITESFEYDLFVVIGFIISGIAMHLLVKYGKDFN